MGVWVCGGRQEAGAAVAKLRAASDLITRYGPRLGGGSVLGVRCLVLGYRKRKKDSSVVRLLTPNTPVESCQLRTASFEPRA